MFDLIYEIDHTNDEFNALENLYRKSYPYLANLNLSKNNYLMIQCNELKMFDVKVYGKNDSTIFKMINNIFQNRETRCETCNEKIKNHVKMFYLNDSCVKMQNRKVRYLTENYVLPVKGSF